MSINNSSYQRNCNISLIASKIRKNSGNSRVQIAEDLKLYKSSVTNIVSILLEEKIIVESSETVNNGLQGRKAKLLRLNKDVGNVVGIEINPQFYKIVFVNFIGETIYKDSGEMPKISFTEMIDYVMKKVLNINKLLSKTILAINFGIAGMIDTRNGVVLYFNELDIHNFNIYDYGIKKYGIPFYCDNDAHCCSWYELVKNQDDPLGDFLTVYTVKHSGKETGSLSRFTGIGIGMSFVINNAVYAGKNFRSGEYISSTWNGDIDSQTNLDKGVLKETLTDPKSFRIWLKDLCTSLIPIISILDITNLFLLGESFEDKLKITKYIEEDSPLLLKFLEKENINLDFENDNSYIVAKGSALMYLQKLFNVPTLTEVKDKTYHQWDNLFEIIRNGEIK